MLLLIAGMLLLLFMIRAAFLNNVNEHELWFSDFPEALEKFGIFFISDIHKRSISDRVISHVSGRADIVVIGGDLTEKGVPYNRVKQNLMKLKQIGPVYFVWGNNDYETNIQELKSLFRELEIKELVNEAVTFHSDGGGISLLGIDDLNQGRDRLNLALLDSGETSFRILVSHYPSIAKKILPEHKIRLVLSGHTHGGQIHILGFSPYERGGIKKLNSTLLFISNGYGTTALPLRLGAPAECHIISLKKGRVE